MEVSEPCRSDKLFDLFAKPISINDNAISDIVSYHLDTDVNTGTEVSDFRITRKIKPIEDLSDKELGDMGERASFRFLKIFYELAPFPVKTHLPFDINFINQVKEQYKPYDICICDKFFDVKTTRHQENTPFHISVNEAEFISKNYYHYYFIRVFPLKPNETYLGIQIASNLGANFYRLKPTDGPKFYNALDEMKNISDGEGFLIKSEWLQNILLKDFNDYENCFYLFAGKIRRNHELFSYSRRINYNLLTNDFQVNYKIVRIIKALGKISFKKGKLNYGTLLNMLRINEILKDWNNPHLSEFICNCEQYHLNTIEYFVAKLFGLNNESELTAHVFDSMDLNKGLSNTGKHFEFDKFSPLFIIFDYMQKNDGDRTALVHDFEFNDEDIKEVVGLLSRYKIASIRKRDSLKTLMYNIKTTGVFDTPLRLFN